MPNPYGHTDVNTPDLVSLGVLDQSKLPSPGNFPSKFSQRGFAIWHKLVVSPEFKEITHMRSDPIDRWEWAIEQYFVACAHAMIFPFRISPEQSKTDVAVFMLALARRQLKAYFKRIELFKKVRILTTNRRYILKPKAFEIEIVANFYPIDDPTFFDWLLEHPPGPMFRTTGTSRKLTKILYNTADSKCTLHFDLSYMKRPKLTVNIEFGSLIVLPFHGKPLSKDYIYRYIEENIWLPLVRTYKFDNAGWRLF